MSIKSPLWGVDASSHQKTVDWKQVKREGFSFGIVKCIEGLYFEDAYFQQNIRGMQDAGIIPGAYLFLTNQNVYQQVDKFLDRVGDVDGKLIALDVEDPNWPAKYGNGSPSVTDIWNATHYLYDKMGPHPILLYSGYWFMGDRLGNPDVGSLVKEKNCRLWVSRYVTGSGYASTLYQNVPERWWRGEDRGGFGGQPPTILQFAETARIAGKYPMDANAFAGTLNDLKALTSSETNKKPPEKPKGSKVCITNLHPKQAENIAKTHRKLGREVEVIHAGDGEEVRVDLNKYTPRSKYGLIPHADRVLQDLEARFGPFKAIVGRVTGNLTGHSEGKGIDIWWNSAEQAKAVAAWAVEHRHEYQLLGITQANSQIGYAGLGYSDWNGWKVPQWFAAPRGWKKDGDFGITDPGHHRHGHYQFP